MTPFGAYCRKLRNERCVSLKTLADYLSVAPAYLSALELGKKGTPSDELLQRLIHYFQLTPLEAKELREAALISTSICKVPVGSQPRLYRLFHLMAKRAKCLSEQELSFIELLLTTKEDCEGKAM